MKPSRRRGSEGEEIEPVKGLATVASNRQERLLQGRGSRRREAVAESGVVGYRGRRLGKPKGGGL